MSDHTSGLRGGVIVIENKLGEDISIVLFGK
jgi:hypothetical protein